MSGLHRGARASDTPQPLSPVTTPSPSAPPPPGGETGPAGSRPPHPSDSAAVSGPASVLGPRVSAATAAEVEVVVEVDSSLNGGVYRGG